MKPNVPSVVFNSIPQEGLITTTFSPEHCHLGFAVHSPQHEDNKDCDAVVSIYDRSKSEFNTDFPERKEITEVDINRFHEFISPERFWYEHHHEFDFQALDASIPRTVSSYITKREVAEIQSWFKGFYERYQHDSDPVSLSEEVPAVTRASKVLEQADSVSPSRELEDAAVDKTQESL